MTPRVLLIGPPGAGKTSVGRALARALEIDFADTDDLIEKSEGKSVSQIFIENGEPYFRRVESEICTKALEEENGVVSLGGGSVMTPAISDAIKRLGVAVVFLDVGLAVAAPRVGFNRDRPLLLNNPRQQWQKLMDQRRPVYESLATMRIEVEDHSVNKIVKAILAKASV